MYAIGKQLNLEAGNKAGKILEKLDTDYEEFIHEIISFEVAKGNFDINQDAIKEKIWAFVKPDIESLFAYINSVELQDVKIKYTAKYFQSLTHTAENLFQKRKKTQNQLDEKDKKTLIDASKDAIEADITKKMLRLSVGLL
ncbi:MAG: hypothetical protein EAZ85_08755 [Bacteroidetes bacterium]|nr:MAG: hypothetical protein EAZ85_08755 [Bacteroidota bacterium]TAG90188.1 MAG: hypothetical protein EAZ20_04880 [Bacteroidota bacterium]